MTARTMTGGAKSPWRVALDAADQRIRSRIDEIRSIVPHSGEIGGQIEHVFKHELRQVIPARIGITSGFVVDSEGEVSRQLDIIMFDALNTPAIFSGDGVQIIPVECTYAAGEVKTRLDQAVIKDSFDKCNSYKKLLRQAYFTPMGSDLIKDKYYLYGTEQDNWPSLFFVLAMDSVSCVTLGGLAIAEMNNRGLDRIAKIDCICSLSGPMMLNARVRPDGLPEPGISFTGLPGQQWAVYPAKSPWALFVKLLMVPLAQVPALVVNLNAYPDGGPF